MSLIRHWRTAAVLVVVLGLTALLAVVSEHNYQSNEQRLVVLQTKLTGTIVQTISPQLEALLGRVVGLAAEASDPVASFQTNMSGEATPAGPYASASLAVVRGDQVTVLSHLGAEPLRSLSSPTTIGLYLKASRTSTLITTRVVADRVQRLGLLLSARSDAGVYVVGLSEDFDSGKTISIPAASPDGNLNFALYFGRVVRPDALVIADTTHLPLSGTTSTTQVPFGDNTLTLVASPRGSLAGTDAEYLPLFVLLVGLVLSGCAVFITERLVRRKVAAEAVATAARDLYQQQRILFEGLQRSFLPRALPQIPGFEMAARYLPVTSGAEVGGDWYSVIQVDEDRFAFVIGDVSGHDMSAATLMASVRYTVRTLASLGYQPDDILDRTGRLLNLSVDGHFVTILVGMVDARSGTIALASAGHFPPLVLQEGRAEFLEVVPAPPLGVRFGRPPVTTADFPPGSTLVAFTDGLIERRGRSIDVGLQELKVAAREGPTVPEAMIDHLLMALGADDNEDDIAVLAVRFLEGNGRKPT